MKNRGSVFLAVAALCAAAGVAYATTPSGILSGTVFARASFADKVDLKIKTYGPSAEVIHVANAQETVMQQIVIAPGGNTGWHSHVGPAVVLVKSGALTLYSQDDPTCTGRTYSAGQAFIDSGQGHIHIARNLSASDNVELWVTYFDVPTGGAFRVDAANPGHCPF